MEPYVDPRALVTLAGIYAIVKPYLLIIVAGLVIKSCIRVYKEK